MVALRCMLGTGIIALAMFASAASAGTIAGKLWIDQPSGIIDNALISNAPSTAPDAEFNPAAIDFDSRATGYTIGEFLKNPAFFNTSAAWTAGGGAGHTVNNTFFLFTGETYLNAGANTFVTPHDDGFELSIPGAGFDLPQGGPTAPVDTPYTVIAPQAGLYSFTLTYAEGHGAPAVLGFKINGEPVTNVVPLPSALFSSLTVLAGIAGLARTRRWLKA